MYFFLHRDQSCYDIIPLYNAMKKKVLSDSDEVSGCVLDIGIDRLEKRVHCLCPTGYKSTVFSYCKGVGCTFLSSKCFFLSAGKLGKNPSSSPPLVQRALTVYWRI